MRPGLARRTDHRLLPDARRVITKLFVPGEESPRSRSRASAVIARILALDEARVQALAADIVARFSDRHDDLAATFAAHFAVVEHDLPHGVAISAQRRLLIGASFTHEYSVEAAALCNPSMAAHPDQSGLGEGQLRFVMTVRCIGEGHISSIGFRTGVLGPGAALAVDEPEPRLVTGVHESTRYRLSVVRGRLGELGDDAETVGLVLDGLPHEFTAAELDAALAGLHEHTSQRAHVQRTIGHVREVLAAAYAVCFPAAAGLTRRLLWPQSDVERNGMEDARLVHFVDDGVATYYATYTAYDGTSIRQQLLATDDFERFEVSPMVGLAVRNKGLALFPRRVGGDYVALSRWDRESIALVRSRDPRVWETPVLLHAPALGWELVQVGNCGPPIETPAGWLVLSHGVGPMRTYALGALLLDLADPSIVLGALTDPLLVPGADEREGYVPNVVYSCGALLHGDVLTIPYGISDGCIGFAQVELEPLLEQLLGARPASGSSSPRPYLNAGAWRC